MNVALDADREPIGQARTKITLTTGETVTSKTNDAVVWS